MTTVNETEAVARIRAAVEKAGTQAAFAKEHGLSGAYVSDVLAGRRDPGDKILATVGLARLKAYAERDVA